MLSDRAARIYEQLRRWPRQRVRIDELWRVLDSVDPATRTSLARRQLLADALDELCAAGHLNLPSQRSFDRTEQPPLPQFVTLPPKPTVPAAPERIVWHPALAWAADAGLSANHRAALARISDWLFTGERSVIVPLRERSLEILGDEKALDRLQLTELFRPDRLTLDLLRARRVAPPLHTVRVSDGPLLLVAENSDTFYSLCTVLKARPGRVGLVGWGAGAAFTASVLSFAARAEGVSGIAYFGDLDANGLRIPAAANRLAEADGRPSVRPAVGLYEALRNAGREQPGQPITEEADLDSLVSWLDRRHRAWATDLLRAGRRLAQEAVGLTYLSRDDDWRQDLQ